jgi:hypothetical protein
VPRVVGGRAGTRHLQCVQESGGRRADVGKRAAELVQIGSTLTARMVARDLCILC